MKDLEGRTPLHHAVMRGHLGMVDVLLEAGGPSLLLSKDILGCTPVHLAAVQNQVTLIMKLVNALLRDEHGTTPLHEVARRQCMQVRLVAYGVLRAFDLMTPLHESSTGVPLPDIVFGFGVCSATRSYLSENRM